MIALHPLLMPLRAALWRRRVSAPLLMLMLVMATVAFAAVAHSTLYTHSFESFDQWLGWALQADPSPWVGASMIFISAAHGTIGLTLLSSLVLLMPWWQHDRSEAIVFATTTLGESLTNSGLKRGRVVAWSVAAAMVVWVGVSRIYLGTHYASDVVAGSSAGVAWRGWR